MALWVVLFLGSACTLASAGRVNFERIEKLRAEGLERSRSDGVRYSLPSHDALYADVPVTEFGRRLLPKTDPAKMPCDVSTASHKGSRDLSPQAASVLAAGLPSNFSWRHKGVVTEVKNQGSVGTCWAFSTTGNIEGQWALSGRKLTSLSEEQLSDCDSYDCGVFGGWPCRAYQYVLRGGGLQSEAAYPYCAGTGNCYPCAAQPHNKSFCGPGPEYCNKSQSCHADKSDFVSHIDSWRRLGDDETGLMAELVAGGPISILINADGLPPLQFHHSGVYNPWSCDPKGLGLSAAFPPARF
jgi:Papain family cysteine protease